MTFSSLLRGSALALSTLAFSAATWAQVPFSSLKLEFTQPTGTALGNESIPVWVKLTNTDATDFVFDVNLPLSGMNVADIPTEGTRYDAVNDVYVNAPFASYDAFSLSMGYGCSGSFTASCDPGAYSFNFGDTNFQSGFTLGAGQSETRLFGTFDPVGGSAPGGTYEFYRSVLWLNVNGVDADGNFISAVVFPTSTCLFDTTAECAGASMFTREVTAVPEPASVVLMLAGLVGVAGIARRRLSRAS